VTINPTSQSLILRGESPEADRRFERAIRLNAARESAKFTHGDPPASAETVKAADAVVQTIQSSLATDAGESDARRASRPTERRDSRRWEELYRIVTQGDTSHPRGAKLDVVA
jgi:hypothetical protein